VARINNETTVVLCSRGTARGADGAPQVLGSGRMTPSYPSIPT
jgi:hypothetical protein